MAKTKGRRSRKAASSAGAPRPDPAAGGGEPSDRPLRPGALGLAVALAAAHGLWSLFQWTQLVLARRGGDYFCGLGEADGCATVWDLPIASAIQNGTGLPVAGWGLVWSAVAFALPLWALVRQARRHRIEPIWSGALLTGLAGIASVLLLGGASFASGEFCDTCVVTYALVLAYAAVCLRAADRLRPAEIQRGALLASGGALVAFLALLYPGLQTPRGAAEERSAFLEAARESIQLEEKPAPAAKEPSRVEAKEASRAEEEPGRAAKEPSQAEEEPSPAAKKPEPAEESPVVVARRPVEPKEPPVEPERRPDAARLDEVISRLSPSLRQGVSNALALYSRGDRVPLRPARWLIGSSTAPVRITEFTDILCSHCGELHETLKVLQEMLPSGSFALEPRQFPLDSECNPTVPSSSGRGVRCLAARAMICLERDSMSFADALFENQRWLTTEHIYDAAAPFMSRERLEGCVASPETEAKLRDDIAWALQHEIHGTPLLLVNGREVPPTLHFLYAMVLAKANPEHPAFAVLPPPQPDAHVH